MDRSTWIPLASLFSTLLSGCFAQSSCDDFQGGTYQNMVVLTPEEYAMFQMGVVPGGATGTTGDPTTGATGTTGTTGTTDASTTGASTTDASTTDASTTDASTTSTTGMMLSEEETCALVCKSFDEPYGDLQSCSVTEMTPSIVVTCVYPAYCEGRRHACVTSSGGTGHADPAAAWLARAAHDEAASVHAFRALGRELAAWGAPPELLARVEAAAVDEVRHAEVTAALARARGAEIRAPEVAAVGLRDLLAIAVENAVEGCVRETWAALSAAHQARFAAAPEVRAIYAAIAEDETRHAELAWAIDAWLSGQLDADGRAAVAQARRAAAEQLATAVVAADEPALASLGVPSAPAAARLCAGLDAALWSPAA